jgi:hypothetical protein
MQMEWTDPVPESAVSTVIKGKKDGKDEILACGNVDRTGRSKTVLDETLLHCGLTGLNLSESLLRNSGVVSLEGTTLVIRRK